MGVPSNKITCLAGSESVGKTFLALSIAKNYLEQEKNNIIDISVKRYFNY